MKRILFLFLIILSCLNTQAQTDSILVVIECDSLYRPFLDCGSTAIVKLLSNKEDYEHSNYYTKCDLRSSLSFFLPKLTQEKSLYVITVYSQDLNSSTYLISKRDSLKKEFHFNYPSFCQYNKYLVNNTCPSCQTRDSISRIVYGLAINLNEKLKLCNPYHNPFVMPHSGGGCIIEDCQPHWYCNRCKKEY